MRRRRFLRGTATAAAATTGLLAAPTAAGPTDAERPNDRVPHTRVHPFSSPDDPQVVPAGAWLDHSVGWIDETRAEVERFLEVVELTVEIDGERVEDPASYWGEIRQNEDGDWLVWWRYSTPPKPPGDHTFRTRFEFTADLDDREAGHVDDLTGYYRVDPGERRGRGR